MQLGRYSVLRLVSLLTFLVSAVAGAQQVTLRPPAVPLVTSDPYLSIWSEADRLTDDVTRHWTRHAHPLVSLIRVDGECFRLMGKDPESTPAMPQVGLKVTPTRTVYWFANPKVRVTLTFMTPALPSDLDVLSRPVTYLAWSVQSADGKAHRVAIYDSTSSLLTVNSADQPVVWSQEAFGKLTAIKVGTRDQTLLRPAGDDARIDWGYAYAVAPGSPQWAIGENVDLENAFVNSRPFARPLDRDMPRAANVKQPVMAFAFDLGSVGAKPVSRHMMIGYDEIFAIEYFGKKLRPYWRRNGAGPAQLFIQAEKDYVGLIGRCEAFDRELTADATRVGGAKYAAILALSYRECLAANGLAADAYGQPLFFTKENTSNGDIATVDVIFPMAPIFVLLSPTLAKASLVSNFDYAASAHWKFPNAPHDLGTYPLVFGRDDGGEGMPVEESGNMIILADAIAHAEGNANFSVRYWPQLTQWAKYLEKYGLDPENQLCTDDFMGHLAHNANLSVKAILALAAYGDLCKMRGMATEARMYSDLAKADAKHWIRVADAGDRSLLAFDKPNTWSQKYNLVWDQILSLDIFPPDVAAKEIAFYKTKMLPYGLPLDSRTHLTKTDWTIWSATMATSQSDFEGFVSPIYDYLNQTTTRDPIADSYVTDKIRSGGMHARPVVGGFFIKMLSDKKLWKKWASQDRFHAGNWAPMPLPPKIEEIVQTSQTKPAMWRYTTVQPPAGWMNAAFDASAWSTGPGGFGIRETPNAVVGTRWTTGDIWLRRTVALPKRTLSGLQLMVYHDEDVEVYINGVLALRESGYENSYRPYPILPAALAQLAPGATITIAVHCHQTAGGQGVDVGLARVTER
jgi:hypothetical protein